MIICEVCGQSAKYQYVKVAGHNLCMDCAVTRTVDDMMTELGLSYENVPDELEVEYTVKDESGEVVPSMLKRYDWKDVLGNSRENSEQDSEKFYDENPWLCVYQYSGDDRHYAVGFKTREDAEKALKNMQDSEHPNISSLGVFHADEIDYEVFRED